MTTITAKSGNEGSSTQPSVDTKIQDLTDVVISDYMRRLAVANKAKDKDSKESPVALIVPTRPLALASGTSPAMAKLKQGMKPLRITLPVTIAVTNTAANLCQFVSNVSPSASNEWTSLQALYDEYRFRGAKICISTLANSSITSANKDSGWLVAAYDPADITVIPDVATGAQLAQGTVFSVPAGAVAATGPAPILVAPAGKPLCFNISVKSDNAIVLDSTGLVSQAPGQWRNLPTGGSTSTFDGVLKFFWKNDTAGASTIVASCLAYYDFEFRSRK